MNPMEQKAINDGTAKQKLKDNAEYKIKRERFAAMAMQGIMASNNYIKFQADMGIAQAAVSAADALLKELEKE